MHPRLQAVLPQRALSRLAGRLGAAERPRWLIRRAVRVFARRYGVDLDQAERPLDAYRSFTDFFTRRLVPGARPLPADPSRLAAPADGALAAAGIVTDGELLQAKGIRYRVARLLGDDELGALFAGGVYHTTYLAPANYHRVHAPWSGELRRRIHIPGTLFSVADGTVRRRPVLAENERVTLLFEDDRIGPWALVLVGALVIGGIETVWEGVVNPLPAGLARDRAFAPGEARVDRGDEVGLFRAGSTAVALFPKDRVVLDPVSPGTLLRVRQAIGTLGTLEEVPPTSQVDSNQ